LKHLLLTKLSAQLFIDPTPIEEILNAMLDIAKGKGNRVKDSTELFEQLGI